MGYGKKFKQIFLMLTGLAVIFISSSAFGATYSCIARNSVNWIPYDYVNSYQDRYVIAGFKMTENGITILCGGNGDCHDSTIRSYPDGSYKPVTVIFYGFNGKSWSSINEQGWWEFQGYTQNFVDEFNALPIYTGTSMAPCYNTSPIILKNNEGANKTCQ